MVYVTQGLCEIAGANRLLRIAERPPCHILSVAFRLGLNCVLRQIQAVGSLLLPMETRQSLLCQLPAFGVFSGHFFGLLGLLLCQHTCGIFLLEGGVPLLQQIFLLGQLMLQAPDKE